MFKTTQGALADVLAGAYVKYDRNTNGASLAGGPMTSRPAVRDPLGRSNWAYNTEGFPFVMRIGKNFFTLSDSQMEKAFFHEAGHGIGGERTFFGICNNFNECHQRGYNKTANEIYEQNH